MLQKMKKGIKAENFLKVSNRMNDAVGSTRVLDGNGKS